jgi:D-aminoacyl-tRNA deacylase
VRAVVQRVKRAEVTIDGEVVGAVGSGLCVLVGVTNDDTPAEAGKLAERLWKLRIFDDEAGRMNLPVASVGGEILVVSQFTLYADTARGNRPSYVAAAAADQAAPLVDRVVAALRALGATVATGRFGAEMAVELVNDGPVTIILEVG